MKVGKSRINSTSPMSITRGIFDQLMTMSLPFSIGRLILLLIPLNQLWVFLMKHDSLYKVQSVFWTLLCQFTLTVLAQFIKKTCKIFVKYIDIFFYFPPLFIAVNVNLLIQFKIQLSFWMY